MIIKSKPFFNWLIILLLFFAGCKISTSGWSNHSTPDYQVWFTENEKGQTDSIMDLIANGHGLVKTFFGDGYKHTFPVYVHPDRASFDTSLRSVFHQSDFKSECWLVATGNAGGINLLTPRAWKTEPCNERYAEYGDIIKLRKLVAHELVHVYQDQQRAPGIEQTPDFDWFEEGIAVYASGQLDSLEMTHARNKLKTDSVPGTIQQIAGMNDIKLRYTLMGSIVYFIDQRYGRAVLKKLLPVTSTKEMLSILATTENALLANWKAFVIKQ